MSNIKVKNRELNYGISGAILLIIRFILLQLYKARVIQIELWGISNTILIMMGFGLYFLGFYHIARAGEKTRWAAQAFLIFAIYYISIPFLFMISPGFIRLSEKTIFNYTLLILFSIPIIRVYTFNWHNGKMVKPLFVLKLVQLGIYLLETSGVVFTIHNIFLILWFLELKKQCVST